MVTMEVRQDSKCIDAAKLALHMTYKQQTVRGLADEVERRLRKMDKSATYSHQSLGHLRSGKRSHCPTVVAWAIEDILGTPRGTLFVDRVSNVSVERGRGYGR